MPIIDTHAHLDHLENIEDSLAQAATSGVEAVIAVGETTAANRKNLAIAQQFAVPKIYVGLGLHPGSIRTEEIDSSLAFIEANIEKAVAVGEIGLDFWYRWVRKSAEKKTEQRQVFRQLLDLACRHNKPSLIHSRGAWPECFDLTQAAGTTKAVFHWYSGPTDVLEKILAAGFYISATPSLSYSVEAREAVKHTPLERLLLETDTPVYYRLAEPDSGFAATPKDVWRTLEYVAALKEIPAEDILAICNDNARRVFGLMTSS